MKNYYKPGTLNAICKVCGFKHKAEDLKLRWDGVMVCPEDYEVRHPSDLFRVHRGEGPKRRRGGTPPIAIYITDYLLTEAGEVVDSEASEQLEWL